MYQEHYKYPRECKTAMDIIKANQMIGIILEMARKPERAFSDALYVGMRPKHIADDEEMTKHVMGAIMYMQDELRGCGWFPYGFIAAAKAQSPSEQFALMEKYIAEEATKGDAGAAVRYWRQHAFDHPTAVACSRCSKAIHGKICSDYTSGKRDERGHIPSITAFRRCIDTVAYWMLFFPFRGEDGARSALHAVASTLARESLSDSTTRSALFDQCFDAIMASVAVPEDVRKIDPIGLCIIEIDRASRTMPDARRIADRSIISLIELVAAAYSGPPLRNAVLRDVMAVGVTRGTFERCLDIVVSSKLVAAEEVAAAALTIASTLFSTRDERTLDLAVKALCLAKPAWDTQAQKVLLAFLYLPSRLCTLLFAPERSSDDSGRLFGHRIETLFGKHWIMKISDADLTLFYSKFISMEHASLCNALLTLRPFSRTTFRNELRSYQLRMPCSLFPSSFTL